MAHNAAEKKFSALGLSSTQEKVFRILVVDDDPWNRIILRMGIENEGYQCIEAENGRTGLEKFKMQPVDAVISDQQMPVMTGFEFIAELRAQYKELAPPVILMSGDSYHHLQKRAEEVGISVFFGKPYHMEAMLHALWLLLNNQKVPVFNNS
jgi:CheY-like chemotaxis protein